MPFPGGPSNKLGNRYELWWTVSQFVRILNGQAESIKIEDLNADKAEFEITTGESKELHQTKRSHPSGKWSLSNLGGSNYQLLQAIFKQLHKNNNTKFIFVSTSDAPELRELIERAKYATNPKKFESEFINSDSSKKALKKINDFWDNPGTDTTCKILQRIEIHTIDEKGIEKQVQEQLPALFLTKPDSVCDALRSFTQDSIHKCISREDLISYLQSKGFKLRRLNNLNNAPSLISEATNHYLETTRQKLIRNNLIHRSSTQLLLTKIKESENSCDCVLIGKAGGGKTGCVTECVETLQHDSSVAVLAFRMDRIDPVRSTQKLGEYLDLEESPALVLGAAAETISGEAILFIDQLDAVSTTSGRNSTFFDVVEKLLTEVRGLRHRMKFHIVVVCREFDWENDHRLRRLLNNDHASVSVTDFSLNEVKDVITTSGFEINLFDDQQLELLCLPQNLSLFLDTDYDSRSRPTFFSTKELFDNYWDKKRREVNRRAAPSADHWKDIIQLLCIEMTESQQLSVLKEKLDKFSNNYVDQMASEGVLSFDRRCYAFGHEAFFDYCFARNFVTENKPLTQFIVASEQHLFRRAQVRQVLSYLRDVNQERYCKELSELLIDNRIRYHLKDLALAFAVKVPNPEESEWNVLASWIESELSALNGGISNTDKFATLIWKRFFFSQSWFQIADRKELIKDWLTSENDGLVKIGVDYVQFHQEHSGDRVAELLEPFVGRGGDWPQRLSNVIALSDLKNSRQFFNLFLKLIDDGTLDQIAVNGTFWSKLDTLTETHPDWIPEAIAHWLLRRSSIVRETDNSEKQYGWYGLFDHSDFNSSYICDSAAKAPEEFTQHILPVILKIADEAVLGSEKLPPKHDIVWSMPLNNENGSTRQTCIDALVIAVKKLAETKSKSIDWILSELRRHDTYMANLLLLETYTAGAEHFADDAVSELCDKTWRFQCGYSGNPYRITTQLIKAVIPHCSNESQVRLEKVILGYVPIHERTPDGRKLRGCACFSLLSSMPPESRSENARIHYEQLKRKFKKEKASPRSTQAHRVISPIEPTAAEKMTDEQWLKAIQKYDSQEFSNMLGEFAGKEPERFARLSLKFPSGTSPIYMRSTLTGLKKANGFTELKLKICYKAHSEVCHDCGQAIADLLGSIKELLPDKAVQILNSLAIEPPDPEKEPRGEEAMHKENPFFHGINTTRGCAAMAIGNLIQRDASYIKNFRATIEQLASDESAAVRACTIKTLLDISNYDWKFALEQFHRLVEPRRNQTSDDRLLETRYAYYFISSGLCDHFNHLQCIIERMLRSKLPTTSTAGVELASLAVLLYHHGEAESLVEEARHGNSSQRLGVAHIASHYINNTNCQPWSEQQLMLLFNDSDRKIRQAAANCFDQLKGQSLEPYENLINKFCDSKAYQENPISLLLILEKSSHRLPGITYVVCKKFLSQIDSEPIDIRTHRFGDSYHIAKLIFRTYHQHQNDEWTSKCLDLIDQMCLEDMRSINISGNLDQYER